MVIKTDDNQGGHSSLLSLKESKADQQKLIDYVGENTAKLFFTLKNRLKSPENDIYYWLKKSPDELEDRLNQLQSTQTRREKEGEASKGAELIYNQDGWKVYHITTYEASVKYGKNTQWCISGSKRWSNGERGEEYFNDYTSKGVKFYFYIKSNDEKYALAYANEYDYQVFNQVDDDVTTEDLSFLPNIDGLPMFNFDDLLSEDGTYVYEGNEIPEGLKKIIKRVEVSKGVTEIGDGAFDHCISLTSINIPNSVTKIGDGAFDTCMSLVSIDIPGGVIEIGSYAFRSCTSLTSINIPNSVTKIGVATFESCTSLTSINIPNSVTYIGSYVFDACYSLTSINIPDGVTEIGNSAFDHCKSLTSINIPDSITKIGVGAFDACKSLTSINIPDSVTEIGRYAFYGCTSLESINIPNSVIEIGSEAFFRCTSLTIYTNNYYAIEYCEENGIPHKPLSKTESLTEASRKDLRTQSQKGSPKRYAKRLNYYVSNFKGVDLAQLFEHDYFVFNTPIKDYICTLAFPGVLTKLRDNVKSTNGDPKRINLRMVIQALREAFDATDDVKVRCTCPDFKYRFMHYAWKYEYLYGDPTPGTEEPPNITNPDNAIGATCKHLDLFLANKRWLTKAASTVNALIHTYPDKAATYLYDEDEIQEDEPEEDEVVDEVETEVEEEPVEDTEEEVSSDEEVEETEETEGE